MIHDLNLGLESVTAGLACGQVILDAVEVFNRIGPAMPDEEELDIDDDDEDYTSES